MNSRNWLSLQRHEHEFVRILGSRNGAVELCVCGEYRTIMLNYATLKHECIPGNFLAALASDYHVLILCGTEDEYKEIRKILLDRYRLINVANLTDKKQLEWFLEQELQPVIYVYGTWRENDLSADPDITHILNGWI